MHTSVQAEEELLDDRFEYIELLGEGTYGAVYKYRDRTNNQVTAIKDIRIDNAEEGIPSTALREITLVKELSHPNIIRIQQIMYEEMSLKIVFDFVDQDLKQLMESSQEVLPAETVRVLMFQLLAGINNCHNNRVIHRDIKPQNILVDRRLQLKIADFGLARSYTLPIKTYTHEIVTLWYRPPEILMGLKQYATFVDIWSIGAIFYELAHNKVLFRGDSEIDQIFKIFQVMGTPNYQEGLEIYTQLAEFKTEWPKWKATPLAQLSPNLDVHGLDLLAQLLHMDWNQRISCQDALKHKYFDGVREHMKHNDMSLHPDD